jgi:hypothetical protein
MSLSDDIERRRFGALAASGGLPLATSLPTRLPVSVGNTYYVDPSNSTGGASDSNTTTQAQVRSTPWSTINHALQTVPTNGATILVIGNGITVNSVPGTSSAIDAGNNNGSVAGNPSNPITIQCETDRGVTIGSSGGAGGGFAIGVLFGGCSGIRLKGFIISVRGVNSGTGDQSGSTGVHIENSSRIEIVRCLFNNVGGQGLLTRGGSGTATSDVWIIANEFGANGVDAIGYYGTNGTHHIYNGQDQGSQSTLSGDLRTVIANNVFHGTTPGYNVECGPQADTTYVVNNTSYNNRPASSLAGEFVFPFTNTNPATFMTRNGVIRNNIAMKATGAFSYGSGGPLSGITVQSNLSFQNDSAGPVSDGYSAGTEYPEFFSGPGGNRIYTASGNLADADPKFNNAVGNDFTLLSGSPAINAGAAAYTPLTDFNEVTRVNPDLGALKF